MHDEIRQPHAVLLNLPSRGWKAEIIAMEICQLEHMLAVADFTFPKLCIEALREIERTNV